MPKQPEYTRQEAKAGARETFQGACNVVIPSYTADLRSLNEAAIRHDVRRNIELGFWGALLVSEAGTTLDEMRNQGDRSRRLTSERRSQPALISSSG